VPEEEPSLNETIDRFIQVGLRRRWWLILPACLTALATIVVLFQLPNQYTSSATLIVMDQQVPERYVVPNSQTDLDAELEAMKREVLSRSRLLAIIDEFHLYSKKKKTLAPEELLDLMLSDIEIVPFAKGPARRDYNAFRISFTTEDPNVANQVTNKLTSLFIQENLRRREQQAENTTQFLRQHLEEARAKLITQEQRLRDFKMQHLGELPEQQQGNLSILAGLQAQLQNTMASLSRAQERRVYLESLLSGYQNIAQQSAMAGGVIMPGGENAMRSMTPLQAAQAKLAELRSQQAALADRYSPLHPDVVKINKEVARAEAEVKRLEATQAAAASEGKEPAPSSPGVQVAAPLPGQTMNEPLIAQVESQIESNRVEIENLAKDAKQLRAAIVRYQNRLNKTPVREQQLAAIQRDYDLLRKDYEDLLGKEFESQLATSLERSQGGRQFRLVDPPSFPTVPSSPKRLKLSLGGIAGGIFLGLALVFFVETRDTSFHTEKELNRQFSLPVLGVPLLPTAAEERRYARRRVLEWVGGTILMLAVFVAEFCVYRYG